MSALKELLQAQERNKSLICLGLDLDRKKMPTDMAKSPKGMFDFAHRIIDATADLVCAYKPNLAFYEALGAEGISLLRLIVERIPDGIPVILDAKRGDIGNTSAHYAEFLFEYLKGDWVTLSPYMGYDSLRPYLEYDSKGLFILCLTSNTGSRDFQQLLVEGKPLYQVVAEKVAYWDKDNNFGLVAGATHIEQLKEIRRIAGSMPLLIPGVGAQGGSLEEAVLTGTDNFTKPALINVSRSVLYASTGEDFAQRARAELEKLNGIVNSLRPGAKPKEAENAGSDEPTVLTTEADESTILTSPENDPAEPPRSGENNSPD